MKLYTLNKSAAGVVAMLLLTGCSGVRIAPAGPDTYMASAGGGMRFPNSSTTLRSKVYTAADDFCTKRGLVMVPVSVDQKGPEIGRSTASFDLIFRALPPGDPEIQRPVVEKPDITKRVESR